MNELALQAQNSEAINQVYNTAFGERTTLNELIKYIKEFLTPYDSEIENVLCVYGPNRGGDIPHSLASIDKAKELLGYNPKFSIKDGLKESIDWYWKNLKTEQND